MKHPYLVIKRICYNFASEMNKVFNKYLSILGILLLANALNFHENSASNANNLDFIEGIEATQTSKSNTVNSVSFNSSKQEDESKLLFKITEIENEESSGEDNLHPFSSSSSNSYNAQLFNELSFQLHKISQSHRNYYDKSSIKLHVRLQVFII